MDPFYYLCFMFVFVMLSCLFLEALSLAGLTIAQLEIFLSSDYLLVMSPFLCIIIMC